jgi:hypothetical protein
MPAHLQRQARKRGTNPKEWRGSFDPVSRRDQWLAVEKFYVFNWKDYPL